MGLTKAQFEVIAGMLQRKATLFNWITSREESASYIWEGMSNAEHIGVNLSTFRALEKKGFIKELEPYGRVLYYTEQYPINKPRHLGITEKGMVAYQEYLANVGRVGLAK